MKQGSRHAITRSRSQHALPEYMTYLTLRLTLIVIERHSLHTLSNVLVISHPTLSPLFELLTSLIIHKI